MKKDTSLYLRLSETELNNINSAWFDFVAASGHPISRSEFLRRIIAAHIIRTREGEHNDNI